MEPLDLTTRPPRGPRETMLGLTFMPRTIDKIRAELPGGNLGEFVNEPFGISMYMCKRIGVPMDELRAAVSAAKDEAELEAWLRARLDPALVEEANRKLESLGVERLSPEDQAMVRERHPVMAQRPELVRFYDISGAGDEESLFAVRYDQQRFQPSQIAIGPPVLSQLHAGAGQVLLVFLQLGFESFEQGEGI